jgi:hypothetical protein
MYGRSNAACLSVEQVYRHKVIAESKSQLEAAHSMRYRASNGMLSKADKCDDIFHKVYRVYKFKSFRQGI